MNQVQFHKSPLMFISFFTGVHGNCPAEWADDKIRVLQASGQGTLVLTGMGSHVTSRPGIRYVRVPSLSWNDFKEEMKELRAGGEKIPFGMYLLKPFSFTFGNLFDYVLRKITKGVSAGRWSWLVTALPVALWLKLRHGVKNVFCTGGPTAAHVIGAAIVRMTGGRLFCEFQDPLLGATMTRSGMTQKISTIIETWLVKNSTSAIYVTQEAARLARVRNPKHARQIEGIYPGAWKFLPPVSADKRGKVGVLEFLHLGTLYGSRNLDLFFDALDALHEEGFDLALAVRVVNLGAVYCDTAPRYLSRPDFQSLNALDRINALRRAQQASCLMLVQHTDKRSHETIPYKTYDYFNLQLPVFGLLNNDELKLLIDSHGGYSAQADDPLSIKVTLRNCLTQLSKTRVEPTKVHEQLDISKQFYQILKGIDATR